jgi:hypothetical protein
MWSVTTVFGNLIAMFVCIFTIMGYIWFDKPRKQGEDYDCPIIKFFKGGFFAAYSYFGILFLDIALKYMMGVYGYGNINYHIASIIMLMVFGIYVLFGTVFKAPTWKTLVVFTAILIYSIYYLYSDVELHKGEEDPIYVPVMIGIGISIGVLVLGAILDQFVGEKFKSTKELWNFSDKAKKLYNIKIYIGFWIFFCLEAILQFEGLSILFWV